MPAGAGRVGGECLGCFLGGQLPCLGGGWAVAADVDADAGVGADVAEPLGAAAEPGGYDVSAAAGVVDGFEDDVAAGAGRASGVFEHEQP